MINTFPGIVKVGGDVVSNYGLYEDKIYEVDVSNTTNVLWSWDPVDHYNSNGPGDLGLGFNNIERKAIKTIKVPVFGEPDHANETDWLHSNAASYVGKNQWCPDASQPYPACDHRFEPDNVIWGSREANIIAIIARHDHKGLGQNQGDPSFNSGDIVWRLGPDNPNPTCTALPCKMDQTIGQHNPHIIPQGLPGAGNMLLFDNGGAAGYGADANGNPAIDVRSRPYSRVIEFNPVTLDIVWIYQRPCPASSPTSCAPPAGENFAPFFTGFLSNAQRLPNGNTHITEGNGYNGTGRSFEVKPDGTLVWEFINPNPSAFYRSYAEPNAWVTP
jgi:hypothetical protein